MATSQNYHRKAAARGGRFSLVFEGNNHIDWYRAVAQLGSEKSARKAYVRALDHTGRKGFTRVKRVLARKVGLSQRRLTELGRIEFKSARFIFTNPPQSQIVSTGRHLPLSEFKPAQFARGTKASPWGRRKLFSHAFMFAGSRNSGQRMPSGYVFINSRKLNPKSGRNNLPIPMWGPVIPKEMVEDAVAGEFSAVRLDLADRVAHEIEAMTKGVVGR